MIYSCVNGGSKNKKHVEYALYKGDEFVDLGTAEELAKRRNVTVTHIHYLNTPTHKKRRGEQALCAYKIEDDEEEN